MELQSFPDPCEKALLARLMEYWERHSFRKLLQQSIAALASGSQIAGAEGYADALGGPVEMMQSEMTPPSAAIIPQMVVWIG